jgi:hypothetical protein
MGDMLYLAPGKYSPTGYTDQDAAQLWQYDGVNPPTAVWTGPVQPDVEDWFITALHPWQGKLLVFMFDQYSDMKTRVYLFNPATGSAVQVGSDYIAEGDGGYHNPPTMVAEHNGILYVAHNGYYADASLYSIDPSTWAITQVFQVPYGSYLDWNSDFAPASVIAHSDGNMYFCSGRKIYSAPLTDLSTFTEIFDGAASYKKWADILGLYPMSDGYIYFGGIQANSASLWTRFVRRLRNNTVEELWNETSAIDNWYYNLTDFFEDADGIFAVEYSRGTGARGYSINGSTVTQALSTSIPGLVQNWLGSPTSAAALNGSRYLLGLAYYGSSINNPTIFKRSGSDIVEAYEWDWGTDAYRTGTDRALYPMAVVPNVGDGLYYSPGRKSTAPYAAELYVYDGVNTPSLVWTGPPYVAYEARWVLCHLYNYNGKILIFMFNTSGDVEARRVYEFDPVTRNTVLRVNDYEPEVGGDTWTGVFSVAEHNGKLLISHAGNARDVILSRLDPSDWSITFIQKVESVDDGVGGIVVHDDGYIYWNTGQFILSSTTGEPGSFTEIYDMNGPWNTWAVSNDLQPHTDGYVYCGGIYTEASGHNRQRIYKIRDNTVTVDHDEDHLSFEEQCIQVAFESTPEGLFAIPWFGEIYVKNGGTWQSDGTVTNWSNTPHSAYFKGKVYWGGDNEPRQLRRRDAPGSVSVVATHDNWAVPIYEESMPMVVAPYYPLATRRPRVQFIRIGK